jgi:hypothetical protein
MAVAKTVLGSESVETSDAAFVVLSCNSPAGRQTWLNIWNSWPGKEVFAHPDYVKLFAGTSDIPVCAAMRTAKGGGILFPAILRHLNIEPWARLDKTVYDLITPYGYGGAFAWSVDEACARAFWSDWDHWIHENNIVSSFARLSLFPDQILQFPGDVEIKQSNVVRSLAMDEGAIWRDYEHKVRKNVNRALREGIEIELDESGQRIEEFISVYYSTMDRNRASERYYFSEQFFRQMIHELAGHFVFFHALKSKKVISTELVLISDDYVYSFLGGTLEETFQCRPNDLIKHKIIEWGKRNGKKGFVLGGGYSGRDGIFRYKLSFAPAGEVPFRVGKKIHNVNLYERLVQMREEWDVSRNAGMNPDADYFPKYRA